MAASALSPQPVPVPTVASASAPAPAPAPARGPAAIRVAILATPEAAASVVLGLVDLFMGVARDWPLVRGEVPGPSPFEPIVVAAQPGPLQVGNGVTIQAQCACDACMAPDIAIVPELLISPWAELDGRFASEIAWVRACHARGAWVAAACSGALLLAEAGLLDGEDATTHWAFCDLLQRRHPRVRVRPQRVLVAAGEGQRLIMSGGGASWMDLGLYLIARCVGVELAVQTARVNLIEWHHLGQQPYACAAHTRQVSDARIARCQRWLAEHYDHPAPVAAMAQLAGLADRSFQRRFHRATGLSPLAYVHTLRVEEAKHLLETGADPVDAVALAVGYSDAGFFARLFRRHVRLSPAQYRQRFGGLRSAAGGPPMGTDRSDFE